MIYSSNWETSNTSMLSVKKMLFFDDEQINEPTKSDSQLRCHLILWGNIKFSEITRYMTESVASVPYDFDWNFSQHTPLGSFSTQCLPNEPSNTFQLITSSELLMLTSRLASRILLPNKTYNMRVGRKFHRQILGSKILKYWGKCLRCHCARSFFHGMENLRAWNLI